MPGYLQNLPEAVKDALNDAILLIKTGKMKVNNDNTFVIKTDFSTKETDFITKSQPSFLKQDWVNADTETSFGMINIQEFTKEINQIVEKHNIQLKDLIGPDDKTIQQAKSLITENKMTQERDGTIIINPSYYENSEPYTIIGEGETLQGVHLNNFAKTLFNIMSGTGKNLYTLLHMNDPKPDNHHTFPHTGSSKIAQNQHAPHV